MADELKTLKDFELLADYTACSKSDETSWCQALVKDLRQEAIKWIKEVRRRNNPELILPELIEAKAGNSRLLTKGQIDRELLREQSRLQGMEHWIKYFFGIKEEDLK